MKTITMRNQALHYFSSLANLIPSQDFETSKKIVELFDCFNEHSENFKNNFEALNGLIVQEMDRQKAEQAKPSEPGKELLSKDGNKSEDIEKRKEELSNKMVTFQIDDQLLNWTKKQCHAVIQSLQSRLKDGTTIKGVIGYEENKMIKEVFEAISQ